MNNFKVATCFALLSASLAAFGAPGSAFSRWDVADGRTSRGTPMCSLFSGSKSDTLVRNVAIKSLGGKKLSITLYKELWNIPQGTVVPIAFDFLDQQPLSLQGFGDGKIVDVELPTEAVGIFLSLLAERPALRITFERGSEAPWEIATTGIRPQLKHFADCTSKMSTQPY